MESLKKRINEKMKNFKNSSEAKEWVDNANKRSEFENGYKTTYILVGKKTVYSVVQRKGKEMVTIKKLTNNPWNSMGNDFESIDIAIKNYKNEDLVKGLKNIKNY